MWWVLALVLPITLHGAYDFFIMALANVEAQRADAPHALTQTFVFLFILTVIAEGVMAHMSLRAILNRRGDRAEHRQYSGLPAPLVRWLQAGGERPSCWATLGILCLIGAGGFLISGSIEAEPGNSLSADKQRSLNQGFSAFAALHGVAFIGLSVVLRRRLRL
jgi:hypothetical protein